MTRPFPGMDPYLEGYLWPDVLHSLADQFKRQLMPLLRPRHVARLAIYSIKDQIPAYEIGFVHGGVKSVQSIPAPGMPVIIPPTLVLPAPIPLEVELPRVEVRDTVNNDLVTSIEILSPTNKREPGLRHYRQMRSELISAGVNLIEIDLIRRGIRPWLPVDEEMPDSDYLALVTRADRRYTQIWTIQLTDDLPVLPVPLQPPDPDVYLDVQTALATIYDESAYHLTLDYMQLPPRPPLSDEKQQWLERNLQMVDDK